MSNVVGGPINNQNPFCKFVCLYLPRASFLALLRCTLRFGLRFGCFLSVPASYLVFGARSQGLDLAPGPLKQAFFERKKSSFGTPWNFGILRVGFGDLAFGVLGSGSCFFWVRGPEGPRSRFGAGPFKISIFWKEKIEFWKALKFWNF